MQCCSIPKSTIKVFKWHTFSYFSDFSDKAKLPKEYKLRYQIKLKGGFKNSIQVKTLGLKWLLTNMS